MPNLSMSNLVAQGSYPFNSRKRLNQGFTYVEALAASLIVTITLALMGPLFMQQREQNVSSDVRIGAAALAQSILENYRRTFRTTLPALNENAAIPAAFYASSDISTFTNRLGKGYSVNLRIRDYRARNADGTLSCDTTADANSVSRCLRIQVVNNNNNTVVYEIETVYTQIQ